MFYIWLDNGNMLDFVIVFKVLAGNYNCTVGHIIPPPHQNAARRGGY